MSVRVRISRAALAGPLLVIAACGGGDDDSSAASTGSVTATDTGDSSATPEPAVTTGASSTTLATTDVSTTAATPPTSDTASVSTTSDSTTGGSTTPSTPTTTGGASDIWTDPTGVYAIDFPSDPTEQQLSVDAGGTTVDVTAYLAEVDGAAAIVSCVDSPSGGTLDVDQSLAESQGKALDQMGAELVDSTPIELQGRPGVEYRGAIGESGAALGRTYVDGARVCNMIVVGEPAIVDDVAPPFLDSFEFLQEAA